MYIYIYIYTHRGVTQWGVDIHALGVVYRHAGVGVYMHTGVFMYTLGCVDIRIEVCVHIKLSDMLSLCNFSKERAVADLRAAHLDIYIYVYMYKRLDVYMHTLGYMNHSVAIR